MELRLISFPRVHGVEGGQCAQSVTMGSQQGGSGWGLTMRSHDGGSGWGLTMGVQDEISRWGFRMGSPDGISRRGFPPPTFSRWRRPSRDGGSRGRSGASGREGNPGTCRGRSHDREQAELRGGAAPGPRPRGPGAGRAPRAQRSSGTAVRPGRTAPRGLSLTASAQSAGQGGSSPSACPRGGAPVPPPLTGCPVPRQPLAP